MERLLYFLVISSLFGSSASASKRAFRDLNRKLDLFMASWHEEVGQLKIEVLDLRSQLESEKARANRLEELLNVSGSVPEIDESTMKDVDKGEDTYTSLAEDAFLAMVTTAFQSEKDRARVFESTVAQKLTTGSETTARLESDVEDLRSAVEILADGAQKSAQETEDMRSMLNYIHGAADVSNDAIADLHHKFELAQVETKKTSEHLKKIINTVTEQGRALENVRTPTVMFAVKGSFSKDIIKGRKLRFKTFVTFVWNYGGGYNINTGIFTAPYTGTYLFHTTVCAYEEKWVYVDIVANGNTLTSTGVYEGSGNGACTSAMGIAKLWKGQEAWVEGSWDDNDALYIDDRFTTPTFTGVLPQNA